MNIIPASIRYRLKHRPNVIKIVENIGWLFFDKILRLGVGLFVGVWLARYLGPEQFGVLNFSIAIVGIFGAVAGLGLSSIVVRDLVKEPKQSSRVLGSALFLQVFGGVLAYIMSLLTVFFLRPGDQLLQAVVVVIGGGLLFKFSDIAVHWFEAHVKSKYTVILQNSIFIFFAFVKMIFILLQVPLLFFAYAIFFEGLLICIFMLGVLNFNGFRLFEIRVCKQRVLGLLRDGWPLCLSAMSVVVYMKIDQIMIGQMLGDEAVGVFSSATRISEVWYFVPVAICASIFPTMLAIREVDRDIYLMRLQQLFHGMVWLSVIVALPMTFCSTWLVTTLFGEAYVSAGPVLAIHIWASVFVALGVASGQWLVAEGLQIISMQRALLGAVVNVFLNYYLIPLYGVSGTAVATVISFSVAAFFADAFDRRTRKILIMKIKALFLFPVFSTRY